MQRSRVYRQYPDNRQAYRASEYWIIPEEPRRLPRKRDKVRNAVVTITAGAVAILILPYVFTAFLLSSAIYFGWQLVQSLTKR